MNEMEVHTMKCPECGKEMRDGYLFAAKMVLLALQIKYRGYLKMRKMQRAL